MTDDEYARKFMGGDRVRFLDKIRIPKWMHALLLGTPLLGALGLAFGGAPEAVPIVLVPSFVFWGLLSAIRVSVTDTHVHVQYGLFGPQIALENIVGVDVEDYKWLNFGGWGIKRGFDGAWAFSVPGRGGKAVRIRYRDGAKEKIVVISSEQPNALKAAIDDAITARTQRSLEDVRDDLGTSQRAALPEEVAVEESVTAKR